MHKIGLNFIFFKYIFCNLFIKYASPGKLRYLWYPFLCTVQLYMYICTLYNVSVDEDNSTRQTSARTVNTVQQNTLYRTIYTSCNCIVTNHFPLNSCRYLCYVEYIRLHSCLIKEPFKSNEKHLFVWDAYKCLTRGLAHPSFEP